jgi:hypothetical protein
MGFLKSFGKMFRPSGSTPQPAVAGVGTTATEASASPTKTVTEASKTAGTPIRGTGTDSSSTGNGSSNGRRSGGFSEAKPATAQRESGGITVIDEEPPSRNGYHDEGVHEDDSHDLEPAQVREHAGSTQELARPAPRNKQELFEELQQNYREVVDLVRKVDAHLDRNEQRGQEMVSIARRIDDTIPILQKFPEQMQEQMRELNREVVAAIKATSDRGDERSRQINSALQQIGGRIQKTGETQGQLVTTMAGFRETLGDIAKSSSRTSTVLEDIDTRRQEREDELTKMLVASRRWSVAAMAVAVIVGASALAVGTVAIVTLLK